MKITIVDFSMDPVGTISSCAGVCYGNPNKDPKRVGKLKQHKHLATFRFAFAVVKIEGISLVATHQLVRSKHLDFLQKSMRYTPIGDGLVMVPEDDRAREAVEVAYNAYKAMIEEGIPKEEARRVLPTGSLTDICVAGNFQAWHDFFVLRVSKHAQEEIRKAAIEIWMLFAELWPEIWEDMMFEDRTLHWWRTQK